MTKKKQFELPKEFATKWLEALRSEKYVQGDGVLYKESEDSFCCLGVACKMYGSSENELEGIELPKDMINKIDGIPEILYKECSISLKGHKATTTLVGILTSMNDGYFTGTYKGMVRVCPNIEFKVPTRTDQVKYSFKEIADFIEANVEFV